MCVITTDPTPDHLGANGPLGMSMVPIEQATRQSGLDQFQVRLGQIPLVIGCPHEDTPVVAILPKTMTDKEEHPTAAKQDKSFHDPCNERLKKGMTT